MDHPRTQYLRKPPPNWLMNLLFLALTFAVVDSVVAVCWPESRSAALADVPSEWVNDRPVALACTLAVVFAATSWWRAREAGGRGAQRHHRTYSAHSTVRCPLYPLTPLEEDRESFNRVCVAEWTEIEAARRDRGHSVTDPVRALCFSGGGIRAAAFSAGVMQEFESNKMLPKMDYLSTVSGGGYTGSAFMTRDQEGEGTVQQMVTRMQQNSDYLGVGGKEGNTLAAADFMLSVTAAIASNVIGVLAYSVIGAEYVNFVLHWFCGGRVQDTVVGFLTGAYASEALRAPSKWTLSQLQHTAALWSLGGLLGVSLLWVVVYGLYTAATSASGAVQQRITMRCVAPLRTPAAFGNPRESLRRISSVPRIPSVSGLGLGLGGVSEPDAACDEESSPPRERDPDALDVPASEFRTCTFSDRKHGGVVLSKLPAAASEELRKFAGRTVSTVRGESVSSVAALRRVGERQGADTVPLRFAPEPMVSVKQVLSYLSRCGIVLGISALLTVGLLHAMRWQLPDARSQGENKDIDSIFVSVEVAGALAFVLGRSLGDGGPGGDKAGPALLVVGVLAGLAPVVAVIFLVARLILWRVLGCPLFFAGDLTDGLADCDPSSISRGFVLSILCYVLVHEAFVKEPLGQAIHDMYRRRLIGSFYKDRRDKRFQDIPRRPYFICNASLNNVADYRLALGCRTTHPFFLSKLYCGSPLTGYRDSAYLGVHLSKGMAISGAALSTQFDSIATFPVKMAMLLAGIDLGEWFRFRGNRPLRHYSAQLCTTLPIVLLIFACAIPTQDGEKLTPAHAALFLASTLLFALPFPVAVAQGLLLQLSQQMRWQNTWLYLPLVRHFYHFFGFLSWRSDPYFYLADGGWFDFLGIYEALRRGVHEIFVFDANADHLDFKDLLDSVTVAARDLGLEVDMTPADAVLRDVLRRKRGDGGNALLKHSHFHFRVVYPPEKPGMERRVCDVWYGKLSLSDDVPAEVKLFAAGEPSFPHHSTVSNQDFDNVTFDAYRLLGRHVAKGVRNDWLKGEGPGCPSTPTPPVATPPMSPADPYGGAL